jgi:hypothetical protein
MAHRLKIRSANILAGQPDRADGAKRLAQTPTNSPAKQKSHFLLGYDQPRQGSKPK